MRYRTTHLLRKTGLSALIALLFALGTGTAQAQLPVFNDADWLLDRGNIAFDGVTTSGIPFRPGTNNINNPNNNPGHGVLRFAFPRTYDITNGTTPQNLYVDNPNGADPLNYSDTSGNSVRTSSTYTMQAGLNPQKMAHAYLNGAWTLPLVPADGTANDYRSGLGGFSLTSDASKTYSFDYAFTLSTHNDFRIDLGNGQTRPATAAELAALPYTSTAVYAGVQNALVNDTHPTATYSSGAYNLVVGNYNVAIYSPGDSTNIGGTRHSNVHRAMVRVSWRRTVDNNGAIVKANVENPVFSRIYEVDLSQAGWIPVQGAGSGQPVFPIDGDLRDQIAVTIYSISPETYSGANDPVYASAPIVTADAVRFTAVAGGSPGLVLPTVPSTFIAPQGRILGPVVGADKILKTLGDAPIADVQPLLYFAREESTADPRLDFPTDPTLPVSATNPLIADPTATISAPVFYCIDSQAGNTAGTDGNGFLPSAGRVRWRYVGVADAVTSTVAASPVLANVRCRDGVTRTMVYFMTTDATQTIGHIYAFDAAGDRILRTTQNYWTYPSYRPLSGAEVAANQVPNEYHDPNYKNFNQGAYPAPAWPMDTPDPFFHYDGELVKNPAQAGAFLVRTDTQIAQFGGMSGSPVIMDDPSSITGAQMLVIGNLNGRVYAFDAGGRGDFDPLNIASTGTTQRIWTWPNFGADAYYANNLTGTNRIADDPSLGTILGSPVYDPNYPAASTSLRPIMIPGGLGYMYAINPTHDTVPTYNANTGRATWQERRNWVFPAPDGAGLGAAIGTPALFQRTGSSIPYLYFNCNGRTFALQEAPAVNAPTPPTVNTLQWAFPALADTNGPIAVGFNGNAPILMSQALLNGAPGFASSPTVNKDFCYVLATNGTLYGLDANNGNVLGSGAPGVTSTACSPIATLLMGLPNFVGGTLAQTNPQPTIVFGDAYGSIYGLAARPDPTIPGFDTRFGGFSLGLTWGHNEGTSQPRSAAASMVDGLIVQGDEGGVLRAYSVGTGFDGLGRLAGPDEPADVIVGGGGPIEIDMRVLDFYTKVDYDKMMLTSAGGVTSNRKQDGSGFAASVNPVAGNLVNTSVTAPYAVDWGDYVYVSAAGVYHAQPEDDPMIPNPPTGPPTIQVTFTLNLPNGRGTIVQTVNVPATTKAVHSMGDLWPDDLAISDAEKDNLSIFGTEAALAPGLLTGRQHNVYPWIAKAKFLIDPNAGTSIGLFANYAPGTTSYGISATATLSQPSEVTSTSNTLYQGQTDYPGLSTQFARASNANGPVRTFAITNPIAVTVRDVTNINDMTGTASRNVIGLFPSINSPGPKPTDAGELVNNGNSLAIPGVAAAAAVAKSLFAPLPMVPDGSTSTYTAIDNGGNTKAAFFIVDRSNVSDPSTLNRRLSIQVTPRKLQWHGWGPSANPTSVGSSVMNALPWELLPSDGQDSLDYPGIPTSAFNIQKVTGEDAIGGRAELLPPNFPSADPRFRQLVKTPFNLQVKVPRYQPANVNYGVHTFKGVTFGSAYLDNSLTNRGDPAAGNAYNKHILGPLITNTGDEVGLGTAAAYPAAGYISGFTVQVAGRAGAGQTNGNTGRFNLTSAFNASVQPGTGQTNSPFATRQVEVGIAVPPSVKMRIAETTLDIGKVPHGTGYTPLTNQNDPRSFQVPFAPDMSPAVGGPFFWDDLTRAGQFFLPFTLYNESNVNIVDVRIAKMLGQNFSQISGRSLSPYTDITAGNENTATAVSSALHSDQVNSQSIPPIYMAPFKNVSGAPGVGFAGVVSSFDHISSSSNPSLSLYTERPLWPVSNPFVAAADIAAANNQYGAMLPTANNVAAGIAGWVGGFQPQPTIGKPHIGDSTGRIATIPDQPYSGTANLQRPRIGVAIPLGTPVGTYSAPVYAYEDNTPIQWQEWLSHYGKPAGVSQNYPVSHDGILNTSQTGSPIEAFSNPATTLKVAVREAKLSRGPTTGTLFMLDPFGSWNDPNHPELTTPPGADSFPAAYMAPGNGANVFSRNLFLYWSTGRNTLGSGYIDEKSRPGFPFGSGLPIANSPKTLATTSIPAPYSAVSGTGIVIGDFDFGNPQGLSGNGSPLSSWWNVPFNQQYNSASVYQLFPATASGNIPFLPGTANISTLSLTNPAVAPSLDFSGGYGVPNPNDSEAYVFWQGLVDKVTQANSGAFQTRDSRVSWTRLFGGAAPGVASGPSYTMPNDPALTKLAPKPMLVKLPASNGAPAQKFLYVFYQSGNQGNASISYNSMITTNLATPFDNTQWMVDLNNKPVGDTKLPTPGALVWQSDPAPVYRHIPDPYGSGQTLDVIDVVFTGVLKGRQTVETLLSRYKINRTAPVNAGDPPLGALTLLPVRKVVGEVLTRIGNTNTYQARDAAWELGTGPQGTLDPVNDTASQISIYRVPGGGAGIGAVLLNPQAAPNQAKAQLGTYDQASGLLYFNSTLGGQILVDMRAGTVRFPQVAPVLADRLQISYIPFVMRLNTSRDDSNIDRTLLANFGNLAGAPGLMPNASLTSSGNNTSPVVIFDRGLNPRTLLTAPQVVFPNGANPTLDRMWVLYRKNDPSGVAKSTIYYKSMRLMVKLPYPILTTAPLADGSQQIVPVNVTGNIGPYEVDWVRGRIYFTEADENSSIQVKYSYYDPVSGQTGGSGTLVYRVAWGDEISTSIQLGDQTTPEVALPTDSAVSEGQVSAFKDPFLDKLWVFWSSTRAGSTDLYFEAIAPQFYPTANNQR